MEIEYQLNISNNESYNSSNLNTVSNSNNNIVNHNINSNENPNVNHNINPNVNSNVNPITITDSLKNSDFPNSTNDKEEKKREYSKLLRIRERIDKLTKEGKIEIFKIIHKNSEKFSKNNNGVLFDMKIIKKETINEIINFLDFNDVNQKNFDIEELKRNNFRINYN